MGSDFALYLRLGVRHIADVGAFDHILFIVALTIGYAFAEWRKLAVLVTAFTVGHSVTLALATLQLVTASTALVEALIPVTILVTAVLALMDQQREAPSHAGMRYVLAAGFGLIHGLGFSTYLRAILGREESIALPLFAFNVGLELGQLLILAIALAVSVIATRGLRLSRQKWVYCVAGATGVGAAVMFALRLGGAS